MAAKTVITTESLQDAKERVRKAFRPSEKDPIVRFIGDNGKMGLRHLMSEEVVEAPTHDFIEMPEAEEIAETVSERDVIRKSHDSKRLDLKNESYDFYSSPGEVPYYPPFANNYFIFKEKSSNKALVINSKGEIVIPPDYLFIHYPSTWFDERISKQMYLTDVFMVSKENEHDDFVYGYVRLDGTEVLPVKFGVKEAFDELMKLNPAISEIPEWGYWWRGNLFTYEDKNTGLFGFQTIDGKKVTDATYPSLKIENCVDGKRYYSMCRKGEERWDVDTFGLVDETGKEILPCKYERFHMYNAQKLIMVIRKKKEGVFDFDGKQIVKCDYSGGCYFNEPGFIAAYTSKDVTLFNYQGQIVIDKGVYDKIQFSKDGLLHARECNGFHWWYVDLWGNRVIHH